MKQTLAAWGATLFTLLVLDGLWLGLLMRGFVKEHLGPLMLDQPRWIPASLFYLLYATAICFFAVRPALEASSTARAAWLGAALGFVAYATYDLTNAATLKQWSDLFSIVDVTWGTLATATAASAGSFVASKLG